LEPRRILIIEDDDGIREELAGAMADTGLEVEVAADGVDGLARLRHGAPPAVILLDLRMPHLGGEQFLRALRADQRFEQVPVISMTTGSEPAGSEAVVAHLCKPFDLGGLLDIVRSLCDARQV
jgi:two-component system chemotaxis response regulator CheY